MSDAARMSDATSHRASEAWGACPCCGRSLRCSIVDEHDRQCLFEDGHPGRCVFDTEAES